MFVKNKLFIIIKQHFKSTILYWLNLYCISIASLLHILQILWIIKKNKKRVNKLKVFIYCRIYFWKLLYLILIMLFTLPIILFDRWALLYDMLK